MKKSVTALTIAIALVAAIVVACQNPITNASNGGGDSSNNVASGSSATPTATPVPTAAPIGVFTGTKTMSAAVTASGLNASYDVVGDAYTVVGGGKVDSTNAYNYFTLYRSLTGDFTFTTRLVSQGSAAAERTGIVAINDITSATTAWSAALRYPTTFDIRVAKNANNGSAITGSTSVTATPVYLRMVRTGSTLTYSYSTDGTTFANTKAETGITFNATIQVGFFVSSGSNTANVTAVFDSVEIIGGANPTATPSPTPTPTPVGMTPTPSPTPSATPSPTPVPTPTPTPGPTVAPGLYTKYNLQGFAAAGTTGGGVVADTDATYKKVTTPLEFVEAVALSNKTAGAVKVIEIMNDLNLGFNEVGSSVNGTLPSGNSNPLRAHATPKLHPVLLSTGVSIIDIKTKNGSLTIFSANGSTIKHATFNIKSTTNIIIRNLKFDEMWEWDEDSKGNYDGNDWDFIDLSNGGAVDNVWIDHCTFTKAYDGTVDLKKGTVNATFSWNKYTGDDGATNSNSWVRQQFNYLEQNRSAYPMYNFLRTYYSINDLVIINQGHDKTHLVGSNSLDSGNSSFQLTFHHEWYQNVWDRNPARLRAGNIHVFNNWVDDDQGLVARTLRDTILATMTSADKIKLDGDATHSETYHMGVFLNGSIATEGGALLVEKSIYSNCLYPLRNNQTDTSDQTYTGKIKAIDTIYHMDAGSYSPTGNTIDLRGDSDNTGVFPAYYANGAGYMGPGQSVAAPLAFSWSNGLSSLPYSGTMDDPSGLKSVLQTGAGAGALNWDKSNWLKTTY